MLINRTKREKCSRQKADIIGTQDWKDRRKERLTEVKLLEAVTENRTIRVETYRRCCWIKNRPDLL